MYLYLLDENFISLKVIDTFESLIWTERYNRCGDFEIYTPVDLELLNILIKKPDNVDYYIWLRDSDQQMIFETVKIVSDVETGSYMTISGRSLESLLDRRIIWEQTVLDGNLQNGIQKLLNNNVVSPTISDRRMSRFSMQMSNDPRITSLTIRAQYTGDNLYDAIVEICDTYNLGFQVSMTENYQFIFQLYFGEDRSYDQIKNPYVIFSPKFENIINSNYLKSGNTLRNVALVAGEDAGHNRRTQTIGSGLGQARKELYVDARDIQSEVNGTAIPDAEYNEQLQQRGREKLSKNKRTEVFEGQIDTTQNFTYGRDFFKGDIVQIRNEYEIEAKVRITEFIRVQDTRGFETYPTFSIIEEE